MKGAGSGTFPLPADRTQRLLPGIPKNVVALATRAIGVTQKWTNGGPQRSARFAGPLKCRTWDTWEKLDAVAIAVEPRRSLPGAAVSCSTCSSNSVETGFLAREEVTGLAICGMAPIMIGLVAPELPESGATSSNRFHMRAEAFSMLPPIV